MDFFLRKLVLLILLQVSLSQGQTKDVGTKNILGEKTHVRVTNVIGEGSVLDSHCKSKDDDFGIHVLLNQQFFEWSFYPNLFPHNTLYFCKMKWGDKLLSFDAYKESRDINGCGLKCNWNVTTTGVCMVKDSGTDLCKNWP